MSFSEDYKALLASVAKKAAMSDTPLQDATEALKALTPYAVALLKQSKDKGEDSDAPSFLDFRAEMNAEKELPTNGSTTAVSGSRRGPRPRLLGPGFSTV